MQPEGRYPATRAVEPEVALGLEPTGVAEAAGLAAAATEWSDAPSTVFAHFAALELQAAAEGGSEGGGEGSRGGVGGGGVGGGGGGGGVGGGGDSAATLPLGVKADSGDSAASGATTVSFTPLASPPTSPTSPLSAAARRQEAKLEEGKKGRRPSKERLRFWRAGP